MTRPVPVPRAARRHDPGRRDRIVDACLDVIARDGVAGTSHRRVAAAAGVPLGSMTYHFRGMEELLQEAFGRFATRASEAFEQRLAAARDTATAGRVVVDHIVTNDDDARSLVLTQELYTLAARDPAFRDLTTAWMARSRAALQRHVDADTARMLDALIEGLTIHRALEAGPRSRRDVELAVARVIGAG